MKKYLTKNKKWKKYPPHNIIYKGSNCFWQKQLFQIEIGNKQEDEEVFVSITEWEINGKKSYQFDIQISEEISITGVTINIVSFSYGKLDFNIIEKHAKQIIKKLIK